MQTKMNLSTTLNAEEGTTVESEEKDTSEGVESFAPGTLTSCQCLHSTTIIKIADLTTTTKLTVNHFGA